MTKKEELGNIFLKHLGLSPRDWKIIFKPEELLLDNAQDIAISEFFQRVHEN